MDVESLAKQLILQGMTPEQQKAVLESIRSTMAKSRELKKQKMGEQAQLVVKALKKIEEDIKSRYDEVGNKIEARVASIKDGKDGRDGTNGRDGRAGRDGAPGAMGPKGKDGLPGRDGRDGVDGVSVTDARIDFDGSLIISLSSGREINVGEVVAPDLAEKIKVITNGGGTSQSVLDTLASLQQQIDDLIPDQTGNAGKFLTTDGTDLAWADIAGGLDYQGTWNAATNTPTLASSVGTNGHYYVVSVDGSTNLNGITDWKAGDWVIFNGTAWQKIDQSWAVAGANDNITSMTGLTGGISSPDFIQFDTTATVTDATGRLYYEDDDQFQTLSFQMNGSVIHRVGEELYYRVKLTAGATKGQVMMFTGTLGSSGGLTAAPATGLTADQSAYVLGIAAETGITNDWIFVASFGEVKNINTSAFTQGQVLYYDPTVTGGLTATKPAVPNAIVLMAAVVHVGTSNGILFVRPTYGSVLGGTDGNVRFTGLASGNTIIYDAVDGVWKNANLTDGDGISITEGAGTITITNSGVRTAQAGDGISVTGTNDITITNTGVRTLSAGTGISLSGANNVTVTNSAPDQVVSLTGAGTTAVTGTYPNFTITSNDQYVGTVTSVGGTGTVNGITLTGTVTSSGNLTLGGTLSGVSLTTQVTGTLPIANGGTGQTTANAAFNALAPSQTSQSGKYLTTDGTNTSWATVNAGASLSNDTSTSTNLYPLFANATTGTPTTLYTSNAKLLYKPSTGELSATVPRASNGIVVNSQTISENYTIASGDNGGSFGPVSVASGITVTVSSGSTWTVV